MELVEWFAVPVAVGVAAIVALLLAREVWQLIAAPRRPHAYARVKSLLSASERAFLAALEQALDGRAVVLPKVRLADVLVP
jgi:hypothetical protein